MKIKFDFIYMACVGQRSVFKKEKVEVLWSHFVPVVVVVINCKSKEMIDELSVV